MNELWLGDTGSDMYALKRTWSKPSRMFYWAVGIHYSLNSLGKSRRWAAYQWIRICLEKHAQECPLQNDAFCLALSPTKSSCSGTAFIGVRAVIRPQQVGISDFDREFPTASLSRAERYHVERVSVWCPVRFRAHLPHSISEFILGDNENHWPFFQVRADCRAAM